MISQAYPPSPSKENQVKEILSYLTQKSGNTFRLGANFKNSEKYTLISARLQEFTIEDLKGVIDVKCREWAESKEWRKRLVPKTLFRRSNFERYLDEVDNSAPKTLFSNNSQESTSEAKAKSIFERFAYFYKETYTQTYIDSGQSVEMAEGRAHNDVLQLEPNPLDPKDTYSAKIEELKKQFPNLLSRAYNAR